MFAVKGWAVDASRLKPQTQVFESKDAKASREPSGTAKKRGANDISNSNEADFGKLWDHHIEGKTKKQKTSDQPSIPPQLPKKQKSQTNGPTGSVQQGYDRNPKSGNEASHTASTERRKKHKMTRDSTALDHSAAQSPINSEIQTQVPKATQPPKAAKLTPMQSAMRQKLVSARFRHLNETLYTTPSATALDLFDQNPDMFDDYHAGFRQQVSVWPENPLDAFISTIQRRGAVKKPHQIKNQRQHKPHRGGEPSAPAIDPNQALPRTHGTAIIADLGCGDARLAKTLNDSGASSKLRLEIRSFDLQSSSPLVTKADISKLPVADGSVDVAIFCLALMGTNWISFIEEAYRILHWKGELWIAEIKSRFGRVGKAGKPVEHSVGGKRKMAAAIRAKEKKAQELEDVNEQEALQTEVDGVVSTKGETDVSAFVDVLKRRGFVLREGERSVDLGNKMFVKMEFIKAARATKGKGVAEAVARDDAQAAKAKLKFLDTPGEDEPVTEDEAKVLKPCLYKNR